MKVLFVAGGNNKKVGIPPFIKAQGDSIEKMGVDVFYFPIIGNGLKGYLSNIKKLRKFLNENNIDIIHAHYTLSAWVCVLAMPKTKIILSLMGTDAYGDYIGKNKVRFSSRYLSLLTILIQPFVSKIISKSKNIEKYVWLKKKSLIIPNGIDIESFKPATSKKQRDTKKILFLGDKKNVRKNFTLVEQSLKLINANKLELITPYPVPHEKIVDFISEADVLVFPSFMEGSPNVIKEAMACNRPIVATNVGDIEWLFGNEPGHYIADFTPDNFANKIEQALNFVEKHEKTNGRERILELGLDSETVAKQIIEIYNSL